MEAQTLKTFEQIVQFVEDLANVFGIHQHSLVLYNRLLSKTKITHKESVVKHISAFKEFVTRNKDALIQRNPDVLKEKRITYTPKVHIKMDEIFKAADKETTATIWKHLLVISNSIEPNKDIKDALRKTMEEKSKEGEFLNNIMNKIEQNVDPNSDPMSAVMGLMTSGVFTELIGSMNQGMKDGSLDMGKLFGSVQGMMTSMMGSNSGGSGGSNPLGNLDLSNLGNMMSSFGNLSTVDNEEEGDDVPDLISEGEEGEEDSNTTSEDK